MFAKTGYLCTTSLMVMMRAHRRIICKFCATRHAEADFQMPFGKIDWHHND